MNLKKVKYLFYTLGAALFVTTMLAYWLRSMVFGVAALGVCAALLVVSMKFWRCPHCGKRPGRIDSGLKFCQHCGKKLDDLE